MRTIFIGDVHGCNRELAELYNKLNPRDADRFVFVGDLVDKGPDSLAVLRQARTILEVHPDSVFVSGNHEEKASRFFKLGKHVEPWVTEATEEDWAFIDAMPLTWYDEDLGIRVVHAGISPRFLTAHPDAFKKIKDRKNNWRKGGGKVMKRARYMLRMRYVDQETGKMLALGANKPGDPFWADTYEGQHGFVVYGHSPWLDGRPRFGAGSAIGIDTACVFGGKLTALVVEPGSTPCVRPGEQPTVDGLPYRLVSVDALQKYSEPYDEEN